MVRVHRLPSALGASLHVKCLLGPVNLECVTLSSGLNLKKECRKLWSVVAETNACLSRSH